MSCFEIVMSPLLLLCWRFFTIHTTSYVSTLDPFTNRYVSFWNCYVSFLIAISTLFYHSDYSICLLVLLDPLSNRYVLFQNCYVSFLIATLTFFMIPKLLSVMLCSYLVLDKLYTWKYSIEWNEKWHIVKKKKSKS